MQYAAHVRDAWRITWRHRPLWMLGLFAGGAVGIPAMHDRGDNKFQMPLNANAEAHQASAAAIEWVQANWVVLIGAGLTIAPLALAAVLVSFVAQGAMAVASRAARAVRRSAEREHQLPERAWFCGVPGMSQVFWRGFG